MFKTPPAHENPDSPCAAGILPLGFIDSIGAYSDLEAFRATVARARRHGFRGALAVHPSQVTILNEGFSPTRTEIDWAQRVMAAEAAAHAEGRSAFELDGRVLPFAGPFVNLGRVTRTARIVHAAKPSADKVLPDLDAAIRGCDLRNGAVISFHHHLRNGDSVLNLVLDAVARAGLKDITVAASALFPVHAPLIEHIRNGVVTGLAASTIYGPLATAVSRGILARPVLMYTHGGRARCIESGSLSIDVAFVAAPTADTYGNISGAIGPAACGPLGYAITDAQGAERVVAFTDNLVPYPVVPIEIGQDWVDFVVPVASIGDPAQIVSGTTRATTNPVALAVAEGAAKVIAASGLLKGLLLFPDRRRRLFSRSSYLSRQDHGGTRRAGQLCRGRYHGRYRRDVRRRAVPRADGRAGI